MLLALDAALVGFVLFFRRTAFDWDLTGLGLNVTLLAAGAAALLVAFHQNPSWDAHTRSKLVAPLRWFGRHSYEVYLSHLFLVLPAAALHTELGKPSSGVIPLYALTLVASGGSVGCSRVTTRSR